LPYCPVMVLPLIVAAFPLMVAEVMAPPETV
jgi:hypothetical protein